MMYCAVIADMIDSKSKDNRDKIQEKLKDVLASVNEKHRDEIASAFTVTLGDEFQGLLYKAVCVFDIIEYIQRKMHPVRFRFGIGLDIITTMIPDIALGADGPAFHKARNMIDSIRLKQDSLWSYQPEIFFQSVNCDDSLVNATAVLYRELEKNWTDKQRKYIDHYCDVTHNQYEIAEHFKVTQPTVNKAIERSGLYKYLYALEQLKEYFIKKGF